MEYNNYWSGAVVLGNMFWEIMRFVSPYSFMQTKPATRYHILGFLVRNGTMTQCVAHLERRQIPHRGIVPFFAPEATDANPIRIWKNVYLGDLLGSNRWLRILLASLKRSQPKPSTQRSNQRDNADGNRVANAVRLNSEIDKQHG